MDGIYRNIIDSHFHTESMLDRGMDAFSIYDMLFREGFAGGIDIGCTHNDLVHRHEILKGYDRILLAGAMGPWESGASETKGPEPELQFATAKDLDRINAELGTLRTNIEKYKVAFIGEIGLDYYWDYGNHDKQHLIFETQMKWANELGLRVLIHDRDADEDVIDVIRRLGPSRGGVIHCFDGDEKLMETALDGGYYISFAGNLTFKGNDNLRQMLKRVPIDRVLMETDSPYLTPVPLRGKPNSPANIIHTYACASQVLGMETNAFRDQILENFNNLCDQRVL